MRRKSDPATEISCVSTATLCVALLFVLMLYAFSARAAAPDWMRRKRASSKSRMGNGLAVVDQGSSVVASDLRGEGTQRQGRCRG